ncbi:MAG: DUF1501 domain-containing protein [Solirubrobacteraceae bacterium]|nr:DUF1501 domain-containing protein [Solirubrobacteraceae bacterium]
MHKHCQNYAKSRPAVAGDGLPVIEPGMPAPAGTGLTRRSMMLRSLGMGVAVYGASALHAPSAVEAAINDALGEHKVIISVFFDGGWDSLSVLAPFGTDHKHEARAAQLRPGLSGNAAIDRAQATPFAADPSLSWNPAAAGLRDLWDDPNVGVAVAPAVGYPDANGSHFTSRHFWEVGALDVGGTTGWMGRYLDRVGRPDVPIQGISMGGHLSPSQATNRVPVSAIYDMDSYDFWYPGVWGEMENTATNRLRNLGRTATADPQLATSRMVAEASFQLVDDLGSAKNAPAPAAGLYGADPQGIARQLRDVGRLLDTRISGAALPVRCISLSAQGGYDTHSDQGASFGEDLKANCDAIKAFWQDLRNRGEDDRVLMLVWSEFGRRPEENGSGGSDHGAAGAAFVIGKNVRQGLIGEFPGLKAHGATDSGLTEDENLRHTSDFRSIEASILEQWLDTDAAAILPGIGGLARPRIL